MRGLEPAIGLIVCKLGEGAGVETYFILELASDERIGTCDKCPPAVVGNTTGCPVFLWECKFL